MPAGSWALEHYLRRLYGTSQLVVDNQSAWLASTRMIWLDLVPASAYNAYLSNCTWPAKWDSADVALLTVSEAPQTRVTRIRSVKGMVLWVNEQRRRCVALNGSWRHVHQSPPRLRASADAGWVEVLHHKARNEVNSTYFYPARGSGVFYHLGRTLFIRSYSPAQLGTGALHISPLVGTDPISAQAVIEAHVASSPRLSGNVPWHLDAVWNPHERDDQLRRFFDTLVIEERTEAWSQFLRTEVIALGASGAAACPPLRLAAGWLADKPCSCTAETSGWLRCEHASAIGGRRLSSTLAAERYSALHAAHAIGAISYDEYQLSLDALISNTSRLEALASAHNIGSISHRLYFVRKERIHSSVSLLPTLHVLGPGNHSREHHRSWHTYFAECYGEPVSDFVDLNTFTWFYWGSPLRLDTGDVHVAHRKDTGVLLGQPWVGSFDNGNEPEGLVGRLGYFRKVGTPPAGAFLSGRVEVMRTRTAFTEHVEREVAWFFHAVGSGVFVDMPPAQVMVTANRSDFAARANKTWTSEGIAPSLMRHLGVRMVVFQDAFLNSRTEIVVLRDPGLNQSSWSSLPLSTGWKTSRACRIADSANFSQCATQSHSEKTWTWGRLNW